MPIDLREILEQIKKLPFVSPKYCDNCGAVHSEQDLKFVGQHDANFLFQITCKACQNSYMLRVTPSLGGLAAQRMEAMNVDISLEEFSKFAGMPKVDRDEALDVYSEMEKVNTIEDFLQLFTPPSA